MRAVTALLLLTSAFTTPAIAQTAPQIEEQSIDSLQAMMAKGGTTSEAITQAYLARIAAMDRAGPALRAVIAINPDALAQAKASDARRKAGKAIGPLDGIPVR
jgi:amidase